MTGPSRVRPRGGTVRRSGQGGLVVTGGGTAGHVLPALAVARALVALGRPEGAIHYVGSKRGMEARLLAGSGLKVTLLPGRGIRRKLGSDSVTAAIAIAGACVLALVLLVRHRPEAVVTLGGYAGVPCALAAILLRIPLVVVNMDAVPGAANRLVARFAQASAVALPGTPLARAVLTGAPVRDEVLAVDRSPAGRSRAREALGVGDDRLLVALTGGSLGARRLNDAAAGLLEHFSECDKLVIYHVAGERDYARLRAAAPGGTGGTGGTGPDYRLVGYEAQMAELLAAADVVICRAGASTIAELGIVGTPSVLVPLPGAPSDHQRANAGVLVAEGAAVMVDDAGATPGRLAAVVEELLGDPARLAEMERAACRLGRRDAAVRVARLVEVVASGGSPLSLGNLT